MDDIKIEKSEIEKNKSISKRDASVSNIPLFARSKSSTLNRRHVKMPQRTPLAAKPRRKLASDDEATCRVKRSFYARLSSKPAPQKLLLTMAKLTRYSSRSAKTP